MGREETEKSGDLSDRQTATFHCLKKKNDVLSSKRLEDEKRLKSTNAESFLS